MKVTLFASISIDGFIADASGIPMFPETAWPDWCERANRADGIVAGRASVQQIVEHGMAEGLTAPHKLVLTSQDQGVADWACVASVEQALSKLKQAGVEEMIVGGGRSIYHAFVQAGVVNEVVLDLQPVAFGRGVPLFGDVVSPLNLSLVSTTPISEGAVRHTYRVDPA